MAEGVSQALAQKFLKACINENDTADWCPNITHLVMALWYDDPGVNLTSDTEVDETGYTAISLNQSASGGGAGGTRDGTDQQIWHDYGSGVGVGTATGTSSFLSETGSVGDLEWGPAEEDWDTETNVKYLCIFGGNGSAPTKIAADFAFYGDFTGGGAAINNGDTAKVSGGNLEISMT